MIRCSSCGASNMDEMLSMYKGEMLCQKCIMQRERKAYDDEVNRRVRNIREIRFRRRMRHAAGMLMSAPLAIPWVMFLIAGNICSMVEKKISRLMHWIAGEETT